MLPWLTVGLSGATLFRFRDVPGVLRLASLTAVALAGYGVLSYLTFWGVGGPYEMPASPRNLWETVMLYPYQCGAYPVPEGWRLISTFMNDNYFGVWVAGLLPVTFAESALAERHYQRRLGYAGAALMVVACTWTYSRAAALALLTGIAVLVIRGHRAAILLLVPVVLVAPLFIIRNDVTRFTNLPATQGGRVQSLQRTTSALQQSPWLGKGPGSRGLADMNYAKIGYETGALGLAAFVVLLIQLLRPALKMSRSSDERSYLRASGILAGLLGTIAAAVGGEVWEMPQLAFTFWLMGGLLLILSDGVKPSGPTTRDEVVCVSLT
jgi:O-antigen ligase